MNVRILLASPYQGRGGITKWTEHILNYYQDNHRDDIELELLPMDRFPFTSVFTRLLYGIWEYSRIILKEWSVLRHKHYDVLHLCTSASISLMKDLIMLKIAKWHQVRTILHFHFGRIPSMENNRRWEWWLLCRVMRYVDIAIPMDNESFETLIAAGFYKVICIPNPLSPKVPKFVKSNLDQIQRDERMILFVGDCIRSKGIYELVKACREIPEIQLVLAGFIEESTRQELIQISEGGEWLKFLGQIPYEEVLNLMLKCGVFVLPSYTEGFPNVILESMACGCAIIGSAVGAIPEMLKEENGKHFGITIPPRDVKTLNMAIWQYLTDPELKEECRNNARIRVNNNYSMDSIWEKLLYVWKLPRA